MTEFPPNVDDARLWLPSDTFFNDVVVPSEFSPHQSPFSSMDDLSRHLAALTLLKQRRSLRLQRFRPPVPTGQLDYQSQCYLTGFSRTELCHHYPFPNPVQLQIGDGSFLEPRARALRRHHNQAQIRNQNRLFQFQGNGIGPMGGGFERVSGGTGVFHPRVLDSTKTTRSPEVKKKPGLRSRQEIRGIQQRNSMNKCVGMGEEHHQLRPDVVLPQEWTY
ncbi:hypothetical protein RchiOBHm_Chr3g0475841 [Rosa chinensis]|uniref:Uncharacterized protein n=1 Tax=Rosa chinensis TaxID=74649 RepID=A0A2P6RCJ1_ROSCH|nr:uncharacterized protein LOC112193854 [Rosa chinensis]PRQ44130.1 hypothetical protein RchiOBHm_Chr3g0475841 [Rosa chinensis]